MNTHKTRVGLRADFDVDLQKMDADGNVISTRRVATRCPNLITNAGLDRFGTNSVPAVMAFLVVGEGNTAPAFGDTDVVDRVAVVAANGVGDNVYSWDTDNPNTTLVYKRVYTFATGSAAGSIRELGLSTTSTGGLNTRALFKDAFGDPTTIDVDSDEQLIVTYRLYMTWNGEDSVLVKSQNSIEYTLTFRPSKMGQSAGLSSLGDHGLFTPFLYASQSLTYNTTGSYGATSGIDAPTGAPIGTSTENVNCPHVRGTYTPGTHTIEDSITITTTQMNFNDLGAVYFHYGFPFKTQVGISPRLNKTAFDTIKFTASITWGRAS